MLQFQVTLSEPEFRHALLQVRAELVLDVLGRDRCFVPMDVCWGGAAPTWRWDPCWDPHNPMQLCRSLYDLFDSVRLPLLGLGSPPEHPPKKNSHTHIPHAQVCDGLHFLHSEAGMVHKAVSPESIIITHAGGLGLPIGGCGSRVVCAGLGVGGANLAWGGGALSGTVGFVGRGRGCCGGDREMCYAYRAWRGGSSALRMT